MSDISILEDSKLPAFMEFNNQFLNQVVYHAMMETDFLVKVRRTVPVSTFKTREKMFIVKLIYDYYDEYKKSPEFNFFDLLEENKDGVPPDTYDKAADFLNVLGEVTGSNWKYILKRIDKALFHYQVEEAVIKSAGLVKKGEYEEARHIVLKAMRPPKGVEPDYYDFFKDRTFIPDRHKPSIYKMKTGIEALDRIIGGYREKWLINVLGATKGGKTWWLIEVAVQSLLQGLNVLFVSLEMGKEMIDERFDMVIGFATNKPVGQPVEVMRKINGTWINASMNVPSVFDTDRALKERMKVQKMGGGSLKVMAFDRGRINYLDIETVLNELVLYEGWVCDVLVVDYLGEMKAIEPGQSKKERIGANCGGLKELAAVNNMIAFSAMQGNRKAMQAEVFHSHLVADDIDTIFMSDLVLAICQTKAEEIVNKYRMYLANFRHGAQHAMIGMIRDFAVGQVCLETYEVKQSSDETEEMEAGEDF